MVKDVFLHFSRLYESHGYHIYMIGGTSRDILLGLEPEDIDLVTDATPDEERSFLPEADYTFSRFGSIKTKFEGVEVDITTMREEGEYNDSRHPSYIRFVRDIDKDYVRRDFTVNAIYIDKDGNIVDPSNGEKDLKDKVLRFIGDPMKRIQEDPLRIIRGERFRKRLGFSFEEVTKKAIEEGRPLLERLNPEKRKMEQKKERN